MITREVNREDSNLAIIKHIYPATGEYLCKIQLIENGEVIRENENVIFPADAFQLTEDELKEFFPDGTPLFEAIEQPATLSIEERLTLTEEATDEIINVLNEKNIL
jgi:hypothetical protein